MPSKKTKVISIRLPNELVAKVQKRVEEGRHDSVADYLRDRIIYDVLRKHQKARVKIIKRG